MRSLVVCVLLCGAAGAASAQSRVYTNADLVHGSIHWTRTVTPDELRGLEARQFRLPRQYDGPSAGVVPYDPTWPFTDSVRLEPQPVDPWLAPPAYGSLWFNPFVAGGYRGGYPARSGRAGAWRERRAHQADRRAPFAAPPSTPAAAPVERRAAPRPTPAATGFPVRRR